MVCGPLAPATFRWYLPCAVHAAPSTQAAAGAAWAVTLSALPLSFLATLATAPCCAMPWRAVPHLALLVSAVCADLVAQRLADVGAVHGVHAGNALAHNLAARRQQWGQAPTGTGSSVRSAMRKAKVSTGRSAAGLPSGSALLVQHERAAPPSRLSVPMPASTAENGACRCTSPVVHDHSARALLRLWHQLLAGAVIGRVATHATAAAAAAGVATICSLEAAAVCCSRRC